MTERFSFFPDSEEMFEGIDYDDLVVTIMREDPDFDENNFIYLVADTVVRAEYQMPLNQKNVEARVIDQVRTLADFIRRRVGEKWRTGGGSVN